MIAYSRPIYYLDNALSNIGDKIIVDVETLPVIFGNFYMKIVGCEQVSMTYIGDFKDENGTMQHCYFTDEPQLYYSRRVKPAPDINLGRIAKDYLPKEIQKAIRL